MRSTNKPDQLAKIIEKRYEQLAEVVTKNIREIRTKKKLTQEQMREHGFDYRYYQRIESGEVVPNLKTLVKLSMAFDVKIADLLEE